MNILLVCTGNTCRSPMAEGILKKMLPNHNILSAGIYTVDGLSASENAIKASAELDIDISAHKSCKITYEITENSDLILCMTNSHKHALSHVKFKTFTVGEFAGDCEEICDPYGGNINEYRVCRDQLLRLLNNVSERIQSENNTI